MTQSVLMENLAQIAAGIQAAKALVTPDLLDRVEQNLPKVRALVTPDANGRTTLDQTTDLLTKLQAHPVIINAIAALL